MIQERCKVTKRLFANNENNFHIYSCVPLEANSQIKLNDWGNFIIKGDLGFIRDGNEYDLQLEEKKDNRGIHYVVASNPLIEMFNRDNLDEITTKMELEMLNLIMSSSQATYVNRAYPNFIKLIFENRADEIDCKNIYNVGKKRLAEYVDKITNMRRYFMFMSKNSNYEITLTEATELFKKTENPQSLIDDNPYKALYTICDRKFVEVDSMIVHFRPELKSSELRCEYLMIYLLTLNENDGNTRIYAPKLASVVNQWDSGLVAIMKVVAVNSNYIHYDEVRNFLALEKTYRYERYISDAVKLRIDSPNKLNIDYKKYKTNESIELTNEQEEILRLVCEYDFSMLIGSAGCVDCETEFFNGTEWKRISEYVDGDKVLQYNDDGTANLVTPQRYIKEECDEMYHFESKYGINQTLTLDHNVVWWSKKGCYHKNTLREIMKINEDNAHGFAGKFKTTFDFSGQGIDLTDDEIRLMCAVICDGSFYNTLPHRKSYNTCRFHIKKKRKKERLRKLFRNANTEWREVESATKGYTDFYIKAPRREKEFGAWWYNCNKSQMEIICDEVIFWDGSTNNTKTGIVRNSFSTNIKQTADFIQFAFSSCGFKAIIGERDRRGQQYSTNNKTYTRKSIEYTIYISNRNMPSLSQKHKKVDFEKITPLDGHKYCFTVPSSKLVLRRNNRIFITGNSGKSSSVNALIDMLEDNKLSYTLVAPSGIAAKRLRETTNRKASTIHKLLCNTENQICTDVLLVDEASMVDVELFYNLLFQTSEYTKVILVFDSAQLASIGCGNLVQDLLDSKIAPMAQLTKVFRYGIGGISTVATNARQGMPYINDSMGKFDDYNFIQLSSKPIDQILERYKGLIAEYGMDNVLILTPYNKGAYGTYAINSALQTIYNPPKDNELVVTRTVKDAPSGQIIFRVGDKVINKKNKYNIETQESRDIKTEIDKLNKALEDMEDFGDEYTEAYKNTCSKLRELENKKNKSNNMITNGDIGYIKSIEKDNNGATLIYIQFDEQLVIFDSAMVQNLLLGYCCTSHASQGCEFKAVLFFTHPNHKRLLTRNLHYMSLTRASKMLIEIGDINNVNNALKINETINRDTFLKDFLLEENDDEAN